MSLNRIINNQLALFLWALLAMTLVGGVKIFVFAGFLALTSLRRPLIHSLWWAVLCGLTLDLVSSSLPFGSHMLTYTVTTACLFSLSSLFFEDKHYSLSIYATLFSLMLTILETFLFSFFDTPLTISARAVLTEFVLMPLLDGVWALFWFSLTLQAIKFVIKYAPIVIAYAQDLRRRKAHENS